MKKVKSLLVLVVVLTMVATMFIACSKSATDEVDGTATKETPSKDILIGKIPITLSHSVHGNDAKWAKKYAEEEYGVSYEVIDPDGDLGAEIKAVEEFIAKGATGIILHPVVESGVNEAIQEARDAGVYIVNYFMDSTEAEVPFVKVNEISPAKNMGKNMAKQWKELYPDIPIAVGFVDFLTVEYAIVNRSGPFLEGVQEVDPSVEEPVFWLGAEGDQVESMKIGQAVLQSNPEVNLIYGTNTPNVLGILAAFEEVGRGKAVDGVPLTEIFAGTDGDAAELMKLVDPSSSLKYTMGMQPQTFAYAQVDTMMKVINGEIAPDEHSEVLTEDIYIDYYTMTITEIEDWFNTQYMPDAPLDLEAELAKK